MQKVQTDFSERAGGLNFPGLITGDDSELLPVSYSHSADSDTVIESQACSSLLKRQTALALCSYMLMQDCTW